MRWQHPQKGLIAPDEFLAAGEDTGLMAMIDQWVIRTACAQMPRWQSGIGGTPLRLAVNLSARHFGSPELIEGIQGCLREGSVPAGTVQLETAAQVAMLDPEHKASTFSQLKRIGVIPAIDDFGSGQRVLSSLRRFSCDVLKIDRALITSMQADRTSHDVVDLILAMARKMNCHVIVESVEKSAQLAALRTMGCDCAQGYYFSSPLDSQAVQKFLCKEQGLPFPQSAK